MSERSKSLAAAGAACIRKSELDRIRAVASGSGIHKTTGGRKTLSASATLRKTRMVSMDEANLKSRMESGAADGEQLRALEKSLAPKMEQHDVAKTMRSFAARAEALNARQAQIDAKKRAAVAEKRREEQFHAEMMAKVDADLRREQIRDGEKRRQKAIQAEETRRQLERNELDALLEKERVAQEGEQIRRSIEAHKAREVAIAEQKRSEARLVMESMKASNAAALHRREAKKVVEAEEDRRLAAYQRAKALEEKRREEAAWAEKIERDRIHATMLAAQEKVLDTRGEQDAERALRHGEARILADRAAASKKIADAERRKEEIKHSLEEQIALREMKRKAEALEEHRQVLLFKMEHESAMRAEDDEARRKAEAAALNRLDVQRQIAEKEALRKKAANDVLYERKEQRMRKAAEKSLIEKYQKEMVTKLVREKGIRPEFVRDVEGMRLDV